MCFMLALNLNVISFLCMYKFCAIFLVSFSDWRWIRCISVSRYLTEPDNLLDEFGPWCSFPHCFLFSSNKFFIQQVKLWTEALCEVWFPLWLKWWRGTNHHGCKQAEQYQAARLGISKELEPNFTWSALNLARLSTKLSFFHYLRVDSQVHLVYGAEL